MVGAGEAVDRRIDVHQGQVRAVRLEDDRRAVVERGLGVDHRGERIDVGPDHLRGVLALLERLGEHDGDRLADEAHPAVGERRPDEVGMHRDEAVVGRDAEVSAVRMATTPGMPTASSTWIAASTPWATSERTNTACSRSTSGRSARYCRAPVSRPGSSVRVTRVPRIEPGRGVAGGMRSVTVIAAEPTARPRPAVDRW